MNKPITAIYERNYRTEDKTFRGPDHPAGTHFVFVNTDGDEFMVRADPDGDGIEIRVNRALSADHLVILPKLSNTITIK